MKQKKKHKKIFLIVAASLLALLAVVYLFPPSLYGYPEETTWNPNTLSIQDGSGLYVSSDGTLYEWGKRQYGAPSRPTRLFGRRLMEDVQEFVLPIHGLLVLKDNGELWSCGVDSGAAVFLDETPSDENFLFLDHVVSVAAASWRCYAVQEDGTLWAWGDWAFGGKTVDGAKILMEDAAAVACSTEQLYAVLTKEQEVYVGGAYYVEETGEAVFLDTPIYIASGISEVSGCCEHGFLLLATDGTVYHYQLDKGTEAIAEDGLHLCGSGFLKTDQTLWYVPSDGEAFCLAEDVVNANCQHSTLNYVQSDGTIFLTDTLGNVKKQYSVLDFAPNRWWISQLAFWKWL